MDKLLELLGLALPDGGGWLRLKVGFGGLCGVGAGLLFLSSGLDGSLLWGALMVACGVGLLAIAGGALRRGGGQPPGESAATTPGEGTPPGRPP